MWELCSKANDMSSKSMAGGKKQTNKQNEKQQFDSWKCKPYFEFSWSKSALWLVGYFGQ